VELYITDAPGYGAFLAGGRCLVGLTVDALFVVSVGCNCEVKGCKHTQVHDVVTANGTVVDNNIPGPESDSVPLRHTYQS
jgi:hypothetical protein